MTFFSYCQYEYESMSFCKADCQGGGVKHLPPDCSGVEVYSGRNFKYKYKYLKL